MTDTPKTCHCCGQQPIVRTIRVNDTPLTYDVCQECSHAYVVCLIDRPTALLSDPFKFQCPAHPKESDLEPYPFCGGAHVINEGELLKDGDEGFCEICAEESPVYSCTKCTVVACQDHVQTIAGKILCVNCVQEGVESPSKPS